MNRLTPQEARQKILRYCAYQERSHYQVRHKLYALGLSTSDVNEMLTFLIEEGFLSEERFARAFAGGKFRMKRWGRLKIVRELERHKLTGNCIRIGLKEITDEAYQQTLGELIAQKIKQIDESNVYSKRNRIAKYAIQKGFEPELVWIEVKELLPD